MLVMPLPLCRCGRVSRDNHGGRFGGLTIDFVSRCPHRRVEAPGPPRAFEGAGWDAGTPERWDALGLCLSGRALDRILVLS